MRLASPSVHWITWSSLGLGAHGVAQFALLAVLARHIGAVEFGVVSATLIVIGLGRVVHASLGPALVQRQELQKAHIASAFALSVWLAVAMVLAVWLLAPAVAAFFHAPELPAVLRSLSLLFVLQAPGVVPEALLQREMNLRALAQAELAGVGFGYLPLGIGGALLGLGVWALVLALLGQALIKAVVCAWARPHARAFWPERRATADLVRFSAGVTVAGVCNFAASQGDNFVVGRWMTAAHLGIYGRAYQLMAMPAMYLGEVVDRIVFPLMARFQHDRVRLAEAYGRGITLVATVMTPLLGAGIVLAPELIAIVLGDGWEAVVAPFQVLSAGLVCRTGYKISDLLARATGTVYARAWRQAVFAVLILLGAGFGVPWDVTGVAVGIVAALLVNYVLMAWLSLRTTGLGWLEFARLHVRGLAVGAVFTGVVWAAAALARSWALPSFVVVAMASTAGGLGLVLSALLRPRAVLGVEGLWLWSTLTGRSAL